jgi:hypothetical protein
MLINVGWEQLRPSAATKLEGPRRLAFDWRNAGE